MVIQSLQHQKITINSGFVAQLDPSKRQALAPLFENDFFHVVSKGSISVTVFNGGRRTSG